VTARLRALLARAEALADLSPAGKTEAVRRLIRMLLGAQPVRAEDFPSNVGEDAIRFVSVSFEMMSQRPAPAVSEAALREVFDERWSRTWTQEVADRAVRCAQFFRPAGYSA
jgi:hypothetical protein